MIDLYRKNVFSTRACRFFLPPSPPELLHLPDRPIPSVRSPAPSRYPRRLDRWHDHVRATRTRGSIERDRVVGRVPRDAREVAVDGIDQCDGGRCVVGVRVGERLRDDRSRSIDPDMEFLPASLAASTVFRGGPFTFADDRQSRAVDNEIHVFAGRDSTPREVEVLAATRERRVIRRPKVEPHQHEERREKALCLTERQMEEQTQRQGGFDREVRVLPLRAPRARSVRFPGGDGPPGTTRS